MGPLDAHRFAAGAHVIVERPGPSGPIADELGRYDVHTRDARGLARGTRKDRLVIVGRLLQCKVAGKAIAIGQLHRRTFATSLQSS